MILQLRDYILKAGVVSQQQLAREFQIDEGALKPMLEIWLKKGLIKQCQDQVVCGQSCSRCKIPPEYYQWVNHQD